MATALMVFCVGQVRADPGDQDQAVINLFTSQGVPYTSVEKVHIWGQTVCQHLRAGQSISDVTIGEMLGSPKENAEQARQAVLDARCAFDASGVESSVAFTWRGIAA
jgi:hypothetical protein